MGRHRPETEPPAPGGSGQVNFKTSPALLRRLQATATALGLDLANLCRMIIVENLKTYEERARRVVSEEEGGQP